MKDKLVIDIETKNTFADVGGQQYLTDLEISFVGVYSYALDKYLSFFEEDLGKLGDLFRDTGVLIGFSINRFDIPILNKHVPFDLFKITRVDLLEEVELAVGQRIGLDLLAKTNLGIGKTAHGLEAIKFYRDGNFKALESYCLNDVRVTKDLYDLAKRRGKLFLPDRHTGALIEAKIDLSDPVFHPTLF